MEETRENAERETLLEFPCDFPIKVMGKLENDFDVLVYEIVRQHVDDLTEAALKTRASKNGNFISVTVTIQARSKQQLDNIYLDLTAHERVLMAL